MSNQRKINEDELTDIIKNSLQFREDELPVVTPELMNKTLEYIRENKERPTEEEINTVQTGHKSYIYWISGAAACLVLLAGAMFLRSTGIISPNKSNNSEVAMEDSSGNGALGDFTTGSPTMEDSPEFETGAADSGSVSEEFNETESTIGDDYDFTKDAYSESTAKNPQISHDTDDSENTKGSGNKENDFQILSKGKISSSEIIFPDNILDRSVDDLNSAVVEVANGETLLYKNENLDKFCSKLEKELSSKKEEFSIKGIAYHDLPENWTKRILIQSENASGEYEFHRIFTYKDSFAVCPFPEVETNPDMICTIYE